jgi:hypothetical protein
VQICGALLISDCVARRLLPDLEIPPWRRTDPELIQEMKRFARAEAFDEHAIPDLDSDALGFRVASESFALVRRHKTQAHVSAGLKSCATTVTQRSVHPYRTT